MKKLRWQLVIILLTGVVVGVLLLMEQPVTKTFLPQPQQGGIYTEAVIGSLQRLNPVLDYYNTPDKDVDRLIYSSLLRFDDRGMPQPDLAESWGMSQDGTIFNVTLRKGVKWHDGQPLTVSDVIFTIELMKEEGSLIPEDVRKLWSEVQVKQLNDTTMQFQLPESFAPFPDYLTFGVLPQHLLADQTFEEMANSQFNIEPVGSGPFKFDHLIVEDNKIAGVSLISNEAYYGKKPYLDQFDIRYYADAPLALAAYQRGDVEGISHVSSDILPAVLGNEELSLYSGRKPELSMVIFNLNNPQVPFFKDKEVRRSLVLGLNRQWIVDRILGGQAIVSDGPIMPGTWAFYDKLEHIDYDSNAAINKLKEAGYVVSTTADGATVRQKDNVAMQFHLVYPNDEQHKVIAESIQKDWALLDVKVELEPVAYDELINTRLADRQYEAALIDLNMSRSPDPDPYPFWDQAQATGGQNYSQWDNRIASEYI
ncbi:MAG: ABC transporter substrate-binding protein, partial [Anaerolineae bacterium]|nr:ABC transporter substrate-binding protein [Anaerolineae bacterium]